MAKKKRRVKTEVVLPPAPDRLSDGAKKAWDEIVAQHGGHADRIVGPLLEEFCEALALSREAHARVEAEGMIVADTKGFPIDHPALAIGAKAERVIERLAPRFAPPVDRRRYGYLTGKTLASVQAAGLNKIDEYQAVIASVMTYALIIDNAQLAGVDALQKTAFGPLQSYMAGLEKLGITPKVSAVPDVVEDGEDSSNASVSSIDGWISSKGA